MDAEMARKTWELENEVETLPPSDEIFRYDAQQQQQIQSSR
jgi:COP9 signalosome complex subunit 5